MNIVFFSLDIDLQSWVDSLGEKVHLVDDMKHLEDEVRDLLDKDKQRKMILFLDFDAGMRKVEAVNKKLSKKEEGVIRIGMSSELSIKKLKKHQQGKSACHGYLRKPMSSQLLQQVLEDLDLYDDVQDFFDGEFLTDNGFQEMAVPSKESIDTFDEQLSDLGHVVQQEEDVGFDLSGEGDEDEDEGMDFSLDDLVEEDQQGNEKDEEDFNLDLDEESSHFKAMEFKVDPVVKNLVDLHSVSGVDTPYQGDIHDRVQAKFDHVFPRGDLPQVKSQQMEQAHFGDSDELNKAPITVELDEDLENELDELTQNRGLPSPDEISAAQDKTGEFDLDSMEADIEFDLDDKIDEDEEENESEFDLQGDEDISMSDDKDSVELDDVNSSNDSLEGELSFSDIDEGVDELDLSDDSLVDEGDYGNDDGLEFDLSMDLDDEVGELEAGATAKDISESNDENGLAFGDSEVGEIDLGSVSSIEEAGPIDLDSDDIGEDDLDLGDPLEALSEDNSESIESPTEDDGLDFDFSGTDDDDLEFGAGIESDEQDENPSLDSSNFEDGELSFGGEEEEKIEATEVFDAEDLSEKETPTGDVEGDLDFSDGDEDEDIFSLDDAENDSADDFENMDISGEETNPTMLMSQDMTAELKDMVDEDISTQEFRPETPSAPDMDKKDQDENLLSEFSEADDNFKIEGDNCDDETDILINGDDLSGEGASVAVGFAVEEDTTAVITNEILDDVVSEEGFEHLSKAETGNENVGHLSITPESERIPPSFHEGEAVRLQATIRQLREERESLLEEINFLKQDKKAMEQDSLGTRAELDEAKIEISILKKRHTIEIDEMKYKLRLSEEKKLYAQEKAKTLQKEFERLQHKVRMDFNQIRAREKELEGQLELVKMDTESQVTTRDKKILDLKRKIDQLEFNMENAVIKEEKSRDDKQKLEDRLERIMKTLRGSIEVLEDDMDRQNDGRKS